MLSHFWGQNLIYQGVGLVVCMSSRARRSDAAAAATYSGLNKGYDEVMLVIGAVPLQASSIAGAAIRLVERPLRGGAVSSAWPSCWLLKVSLRVLGPGVRPASGLPKS